ncbi:MAG TPA: aromatic ring-hydroxylating dioxygenase subunit alpha [Pseudonocardia sp.]|jgi:phenylpropionate dioxygenase-like ring-hydroxylating dioxygenase large terminal subunit|nr:aromatic ring-hydroxylating dioxygenase subunit alpha [Pseudonocardia sp.]
MTTLSDDQAVIDRVLAHIDGHSTDLSAVTWREPVASYLSESRLVEELRVFRRQPTVFCPSAVLPEPGSYLARDAAGAALLAARGRDGGVRVFRNACRHRGVQVAEGEGCRTAFVCPYHGWTYGLGGELRHVPHGHGFPELEADRRGLVEVPAVERAGLVFVTQEQPAFADTGLGELDRVLPAGSRLVRTTVQEIPANWKILMEGFLEGYHLRATHRSTFYPRQFDNLNVVEQFGPHSRVTFPYRKVDELRGAPVHARSAAGVLTYVYHLFPNVVVATFPFNTVVIVHEPLAVDSTKVINYSLSHGAESDEQWQHGLKRSLDFQQEGANEDRDVCVSIQRGLTSGANEFFEFGRFEGALSHFHDTLHKALDTVS